MAPSTVRTVPCVELMDDAGPLASGHAVAAPSVDMVDGASSEQLGTSHRLSTSRAGFNRGAAEFCGDREASFRAAKREDPKGEQLQLTGQRSSLRSGRPWSSREFR